VISASLSGVAAARSRSAVKVTIGAAIRCR
jgi:hypothetical protein